MLSPSRPRCVPSEHNTLFILSPQVPSLLCLLSFLLCRSKLMENDNVLFVGYKVPHPLTHAIELKVVISTHPCTMIWTNTQRVRPTGEGPRNRGRSLVSQRGCFPATPPPMGPPMNYMVPWGAYSSSRVIRKVHPGCHFWEKMALSIGGWG